MLQNWLLIFVSVCLLLNALSNMLLHGRIRRSMEKISDLALLLGAKSYRISDDGKSITCLKCQATSYHPEDVRQRYCGNCHVFYPR